MQTTDFLFQRRVFAKQPCALIDIKGKLTEIYENYEFTLDKWDGFVLYGRTKTEQFNWCHDERPWPAGSGHGDDDWICVREEDFAYDVRSYLIKETGKYETTIINWIKDYNNNYRKEVLTKRYTNKKPTIETLTGMLSHYFFSCYKSNIFDRTRRLLANA